MYNSEELNRACYFDMIEYFCNGHDDIAVDVVIYDSQGMQISKKIFKWGVPYCDAVTSIGIRSVADEYAHSLIQAGIPCRDRKEL